MAGMVSPEEQSCQLPSRANCTHRELAKNFMIEAQML
jgi:hypothetical protein